MSRATIIYILVLLASVTGVSLIIERGMRLHAPPDLSGEWRIQPAGLGVEPETEQALGGNVVIEQSGQFVRLSFESKLRLDLKLAPHVDLRPADARSDGLALEFNDERWALKASGRSRAGPLICELVGPTRHSFVLTRPRPLASAPLPPIAPMTQTATADDADAAADLAPADAP